MEDGIYRLLSHLEVSELAHLSIGSRFAVEGTMQGAHRSPLKGSSVEFSDYRQYVPGDDVRHVDWKVFGRKERLYIRQYEEESNLRVYLLVDVSKSMAFGYENISKYNFAAKLAAALAYVTVQQQDSVGLQLFDRRLRQNLTARSGREHLRVLANTLAESEPGEETDMLASFDMLTQKARRRALVVILSDLYDENPDALKKVLSRFHQCKHNVMVYHVVDRAELELPFRNVGRFRNLETGEELLSNPNEIRSSYQEAVANFLEKCRTTCSAMDTEYTLVCTDQSPVPFVRNHLARRQLYTA